MSIINATAARNNFFKVMDEAILTNEPIFVTGRAGTVVVLSEDDYKSIQETLYLLSVPGMRETLVKRANAPKEDFIDLEGLLGEEQEQ